MILYSLRTHHQVFRITKFDRDLNPESSYLVHSGGCECPQWTGRAKECRHMKMLRIMKPRVDTPWFYCFENGTWHDPTGTAEAPADAFNKALESIRPMTPNDLEAVKTSEYLGTPIYEIDSLRPPGEVAGEGPGPSPLAVPLRASPSQGDIPDRRSEPAPFKRRV